MQTDNLLDKPYPMQPMLGHGQKEMTSTKWFGTCEMCGAKEQQLSTTQTSLGPIRYYIKRCCDHCQAVMRLDIDHTMLILVADRKQLEREKRLEQKK